ncbi:M23 family metallopeptidase [Streptomyces sp. Z26]|uniref:M23 family metallopeptidase n=1 Tax=Streptomyces TaxID=1883 RepID=UPI000EF13808|nr:M23 family metallopeptidase [Streptomyces sp. Z26]RLL66293.1 M23 family metallopeptidase [Streptomyces sp. Z26]
MPKKVTPATFVNTPRGQAALLSTGLCAALALGAGVAAAAEPAAAPHDPFAASAAGDLAEATRQQSDAQYEAAATAAREKAEAKKEKAEAAKAAKKAAAKKAASWVRPVAKPYTLTASFGNSGDRWSAKHSGQDFAIPVGTPVNSVHKGTVVEAGNGGAYGNNVVIKHPNGKFSQYAHLSKIDVRVGEHVNTEERIARSGNTGNTSGPHLHFEIRTTAAYGSGFDPMPFLHKHGVKV